MGGSTVCIVITGVVGVVLWCAGAYWAARRADQHAFLGLWYLTALQAARTTDPDRPGTIDGNDIGVAFDPKRRAELHRAVRDVGFPDRRSVHDRQAT